MKHYLVRVVLKNGNHIEFKNEEDPGSISQIETPFVCFDTNKYRDTSTVIRCSEVVLWQVKEVSEGKVL